MSPIRMTEPLNSYVLWLDAEKQEYMGHERKGARFVLKFTVGTKRTSNFLAYLLKNIPCDGLYFNCSISPRRKKTVTVCLTYNGLQSLAKALEHLPRVGLRVEKTLDRVLSLLAKKRKSASMLLEIPGLPQELKAKAIAGAL
jgi:hypothetical protein